MKTAAIDSKSTSSHHDAVSNHRGETSFFSFDSELQAPFFSSPILQPRLTVGAPDDPFEREANQTADHVIGQIDTAPTALEKGKTRYFFNTTPITPIQRLPNAFESEEELSEETTTEEPVQRKLAFESNAPPPDDDPVQPKSSSQGALPGNRFESTLTNSKHGGATLPDNTRSQMEQAFDADFSTVRIHTDANAVQMNRQLGAQAFTHGSDIYFSEGAYQPETRSGKHLLAHELTHTIQQGHSVQRKPAISSTSNEVQGLFGLSVDSFRNRLAGYAEDYLPAYSMVSLIIGFDLIRGRSVARNQANIVKALFSLINPFGSLLRKRLEERNLIETAFQWIKSRLDGLGITLSNIKQSFLEFWEEKDLLRTDFLSYNLGLLRRKFSPYVRSVVEFASEVSSKVFQMIKDAFLQLLAGLAKRLGGYDLLADLLGFDPITGEQRSATTADILRGILKLPIIQRIGGDKLLQKLEEHTLITRTAAWIDEQWALLQGGFADLKAIGTKFLEGFSVETLVNPMAFVNEIKAGVVGFVTKIGTFFLNLASKALELIKEVSIFLLKKYVNENTYGFDLVKVILGKDPFTREPFPRTAENIIGAFLKLLPGGDRVFAKLKETGAIQRTTQWIMNAIQEFVQILTAMKVAFLNLWSSSRIEDLFEPVAFFARIVNLFLDPVKRMVAFVKKVLMKVIEVLLQIMNFPINLIRKIIDNVVRAYNQISQDPIGFLLRLLGAVKEGFARFFNNIGAHLLAGVTGWLFGQVEKAGITPPKDLSLQSILGFVLQILDLTVERLWQALARRIGQDKVDKLRSMLDKLEGIWLFIKDVQENGISAIWRYVQSQISNLWNIVLEQVKSWIMTQIIQKIVTKLLSMLDPTGIMAVVNGFIAFFRAIQSAIEYFRRMLEIVESFTSGIVEIATGNISRAAQFLEGSLARALPVAIGFLANQVGLGNLGSKMAEIIEKVRGVVDQALDWLIDKAIKLGKGILNVLKRGVNAAKEGVAALVQWWKAKVSFRGKDGQSHRLYFKGGENDATLMIASEPKTFAEYIGSLEVKPEQASLKSKAIGVAQEVDTIKRSPTAAPTKEEVKQKKTEKKEELQAKLNELAPIVAELFGLVGELPDSEINYDTVNRGGVNMGLKMTASTLTTKGDPGSSPSESNALWEKLIARRDGGRSYYIRGHLLNDNVHGPGTWKNMTPLSQEGNKNHERTTESTVKKAVLSGGVVEYIVEVIYGRSVPEVSDDQLRSAGIEESNWNAIKEIRMAEQHVPQGLTVSSTLLTQDNDNEFTVKKPLVSNKSILNPVNTDLSSYEVGEGKSKENVSLRADSAEKIAENTNGVDINAIQAIQVYATSIEKLTRYDQIRDLIEQDSNLSRAERRRYNNALDKLKDARNVRLN